MSSGALASGEKAREESAQKLFFVRRKKRMELQVSDQEKLQAKEV